MKGEGFFRRAISEYKEYHLTESLRKTFKKNDLKFPWLNTYSISWLPHRAAASSATQTNNASSKTDYDKDGKQRKPVLQRNASFKNKITSTTKDIRRSLLENFKHSSIVKLSHSNGSTREEITGDDNHKVVYFNASEYMYRPYASNTRRKAICDEIEKYIVQNGGTLRPMRSDLIVAVSLSNWHLL